MAKGTRSVPSAMIAPSQYVPAGELTTIDIDKGAYRITETHVEQVIGATDDPDGNPNLVVLYTQGMPETLLDNPLTITGNYPVAIHEPILVMSKEDTACE